MMVRKRTGGAASEPELDSFEAELAESESGYLSEEERKGKIVSRAEMRRIIGCADSTLEKMIQDRAPVEERGKQGVQWKFATAPFIKWLIRRHVLRAERMLTGLLTNNADTLKMLNPNDPRYRERMASAERLENKLAQERGETISIADMKDLVAVEYAVVRSRLGAIPGRIEEQLATMTDPQAIGRLLKAEIAGAQAGLTTEESEDDF